MGIIYCYHDMMSWGSELAAEIQKLKGSSQMMTHAVQVEDEVGTAAFIHVSDRERQYTQELAEVLGKKENILMTPTAREIYLHDDFSRQYSEFGKWMPTTWVLHSLEQAQDHINKLEYPVMSLPCRQALRGRRVLADTEDAYRDAASIFSDEGLQLADGTTQQGYVIWQPMARHIGVRWHIFMLAKKYAVVIETPTGIDPTVPGANFTMVDTMEPGYAELLKYVQRFAGDCDLDWAMVEVVPFQADAKMIQPYIVGFKVSWPFTWFERGGMIFGSEDGQSWQSTGIPAVKLWHIVAEWMLNKVTK